MAKIVQFTSQNDKLKYSFSQAYACSERGDHSGEYVSLSDHEALQAENAKLREELKSMLNIFDRALPDTSIGRMVCDKAIEALK